MAIRIRFIPPFAAFCFGAFVAIAIVALLTIPQMNNTGEAFIEDYGQALASTAAKQAVDATFNHDLVRLQMILQDVMENPHTLVATMHDVENTLLVQAGDMRSPIQSRRVFTAPIVLHDSLAGSISVTVNTQPWSMPIGLVWALAVLSLLLSVWSVIQSRAILWRRDTPSSHIDDTKTIAPPSPTPSLKPCETLNDEQVFAIIHIKNLTVLTQQLNGQAFRDTIAQLEHVIQEVMALYGGHRFELKDNCYILHFPVIDQRGEALFHATCSAYLILELAGIVDNIPLDLAAMVSANHEDIVPEKLPFAGLVLEATAGLEAFIHQRIEFMDLGTDDGRQVLARFHPPYNTLLEKQQSQLNQRF